jgi:peptide/nickel transport system ATP-binding protein
MSGAAEQAPLIEARGLTKHFRLGGRFSKGGVQIVHALDGVSLAVRRGETLALVGESGCGKSTLGRCLLRLYDLTAGQVIFEGADISRWSQRRLRRLRPRMQMVFQDPYASLNPRRRVGDLLAEPMRVHTHWNAARVSERLHELMRLVGLPREHLMRYPHEFSGGQRQRVGIARALALQPSLVVADEPVSALDVSVQAQIVNLMMDLQERLGLTYIFIAHDLSVVRQIANRTAVMYLGTIVETGPTDALFGAPAHHYTHALLSAVPEAETARRRDRVVLGGEVPSPLSPPSGCRFHTRCPRAEQRCRSEVPVLRAYGGPGREVACHFPLHADAAGTTAPPEDVLSLTGSG